MGEQAVQPLTSFISTKVKGNFTAQNKSVSVQTTTTDLLPNNFGRMSVVMSNFGSYDIFVWPGELPAGASGIKIGADGGVLTLSAGDDLVLVGYDWSGIAPAGASDLLIVAVEEY